MAIQKQFVLRYRDDGHLRFEVPGQFCEAATAKALTAALLAVEGVYRVHVYTQQQKLSIRYQESICDFKTLAKLLFQIIADVEKQQLKEQSLAKVKSKFNFKHKIKNLAVSKWFGQKYDDTKETIQAAKILTKGLKKKKVLFNDPEKALFDFLNDMLVLFLIRLHWDRILKEWLPNPLKYRYEWMAVFYMIMLLMRSRKPK
jgi:cation transport ATPase